MAKKISKSREVRKDASKYETGLFGWKRGDPIAWIQFFNEDSHQIIYEPTTEEIEKAADEYGLDPTRLINAIVTRHPEMMGFVVDVERYRETGGNANSSNG